jgi:hypothetical protein
VHIVYREEKLLYNAENKLLLSSISFQKDINPAQQISKILSERKLDWRYILRNARQNRITPFLYRNLLKVDAERLVPNWVTQDLAQTYHSVGFQNLRFYEELKNILLHFKNLGIGVIVLKGTVLAEIIWGNVALRQMEDIDLLVQENDLERVERLLSKLGYILYEGYQSQEWYRNNHHHLAPYCKPDKRMVVEIHRNLVSPNKLFSIDIHRVWERSQTIKIGDIETKMLAPEDFVVHLCLTISYSDLFIGKIMNLIDLSQTIKYYDKRIDWDWIIKQVNENKTAKFIYYPLYLAKDLLNVEIEKEILDSLRDNFDLSLFEDRLLKLIIKTNIFSKDEEVSVLPKWILASLCSDLLHNDNTHRRIKSLFRTLFLSPNGSEANISSPSFARRAYCYYPILRFFQVLSKSIGIVMKAVFHKRAPLINLITEVLHFLCP